MGLKMVEDLVLVQPYCFGLSSRNGPPSSGRAGHARNPRWGRQSPYDALQLRQSCRSTLRDRFPE
jgi:hypothetical protein